MPTGFCDGVFKILQVLLAFVWFLGARLSERVRQSMGNSEGVIKGSYEGSPMGFVVLGFRVSALVPCLSVVVMSGSVEVLLL